MGSIMDKSSKILIKFSFVSRVLGMWVLILLFLNVPIHTLSAGYTLK